MSNFLWLTVVVISSLVHHCSPYNDTIAANQQNNCILKHMLARYGKGPDITFNNMAQLFDAVTIGYHNGSVHAQLTSSITPTVGHRYKKSIHSLILPGDHDAKHICKTEMEDTLHECLPGSEILMKKGYASNSTTQMTVNDFVHLCPSLIYQLVMTPCIFHPHTFLKEPNSRIESATNKSPYLAWIGGLAAVFIISAVGLAVICIIPLIKRTLYQTIIQYLVALAVGTLVGDALLHLLPHALSEHEEQSSDLTATNVHVWRATISLLGIYVFFNAERLLSIYSNKKQQKKDKGSTEDPIGFKDSDCSSGNKIPAVIAPINIENNFKLQSKNIKLCDTYKGMSLHNSMPELNYTPSYFNVGQKTDHQKTKSPTGEPLLIDALTSKKKCVDINDNHGHSHEVPSSCSSVAYMVVMGDGLHNFTDGLAIGAAFASSFTGGMSTSIAVLCHELPHELGDFAMLLKSGMTVKQAFLCNLLSACLQLVGVVIGVAIGHLETASQWLFALAGGIFLYVGLVDMLPEISKIDHHRCWKQLLLQNFGLLSGFALMFVIAIFEADIETTFQIDQ